MGGMGGMPMNGGGNCPCQPACQPCMPWTPCQPCSCPCSPAPTTPGPEETTVRNDPICVNGAPNEFFPDCCFNGGRGKFCCTNGADNLHCCINGANNPQCELPTEPPVSGTTPSTPGGGCNPCMPCQPCMIWWMCPPCGGCNNGCATTEAPTTPAPEIPTAPPSDPAWDPMNCACVCAPCQRNQPCPPCPRVCPCFDYLH